MKHERHRLLRYVGLTFRVRVVLMLLGIRVLHQTVADVINSGLDLAELRLLLWLVDAQPGNGTPQEVIDQVYTFT